MNAIEPARRVFCLPFINTEAWAGYLAYTEYRRIFSEQSSEEEINRWLLRIAVQEGRTVNLRHIMDFGFGRFDIHILNTGQIVHTMRELVPVAGLLV